MGTKIQSDQLPTLGYLCNGRLTLETGVPVSTSDQADKTTLYFTPYMGDLIYIYDGTSWVLYSFAELSLNISAFTASKPYDIFIYDNAGTLTLEGLVWTDATTRATALTTQNGIYVLTGATEKRYLGTIYMDAASKCQDSLVKRFVWNYYNRSPKLLYTVENTAHFYNGAYRLWNNSSTNNLLNFIIGVLEIPEYMGGGCLHYAGADDYSSNIALYLNGTITIVKGVNSNKYYIGSLQSVFLYPIMGYNTMQMYQYSDHASSRFAEMKMLATIQG